MEESTKTILKRLSNELSQINIDTFLKQIQNSTQVTECYDISLKPREPTKFLYIRLIYILKYKM